MTFDPFEINHVKEYEQRWNDVATRRDRITTSGGASGTALWKWPDEEWWVRNGSWHLAVDGKGVETCWESWRGECLMGLSGLGCVSHELSTLQVHGLMEARFGSRTLVD